MNSKFELGLRLQIMLLFTVLYMIITYFHHYVIWPSLYAKGKIYLYCIASFSLLLVGALICCKAVAYFFTDFPEVVKFYNVDRGYFQYVSDMATTAITFSVFHLNKDFLAFQRRFDTGANSKAIKSYDEYMSAVSYETIERKISQLKTNHNTSDENTIYEIAELEALLDYQLNRQTDRLSLIFREVKHLEEYIDLFNASSEKSYRIHLHKNGEFENYKILNHCLIPFVEHVFERGVPTIDEQGSIEIAFSVESDKVYFIIKSSHKSLTDKIEESDKMRAVKNRLQKHYAWKHELIINENRRHFNLFLKFPKEIG